MAEAVDSGQAEGQSLKAADAGGAGTTTAHKEVRVRLCACVWCVWCVAARAARGRVGVEEAPVGRGEGAGSLRPAIGVDVMTHCA